MKLAHLAVVPILALLIATACSIEIDAQTNHDDPAIFDSESEPIDAGGALASSYRGRVSGLIFDERFRCEATLTLHDDHRFLLRVEGETDSDFEVESFEGTYRVVGSHLYLRGDHEDGELHFRLKGDELVFREGWLGTLVHETFGIPRWTLERVS
jgi:hypothetical protein